jgi:hypothetical protein
MVIAIDRNVTPKSAQSLGPIRVVSEADDPAPAAAESSLGINPTLLRA